MGIHEGGENYMELLIGAFLISRFLPGIAIDLYSNSIKEQRSLT
jgi:hypothetical protein